MSPGQTFDRVYLWLKERLVGGRFMPGAPLEPAHLTDSVASSITPIRDALHRLSGERLVEASWGEGFRVPAPTEAELRALYAWNLTLLELALRSGEAAPFLTTQEAQAPIDRITLAIARRGGPEHEAAVASLNDRLGAARSVEHRLFEDWETELRFIVDLLHKGEVRGARKGIAAYHRRRIRAVPEVVTMMRMPVAP